MAQEKAIKIDTYRDKYTSTVTYLYRGKTYEVTYSNCMSYCVTPAWVQHRDAQAEIDKVLDNPTNQTNEHPFDLDEVFEMLEA